jgi:hypothetical protein
MKNKIILAVVLGFLGGFALGALSIGAPAYSAADAAEFDARAARDALSKWKEQFSGGTVISAPFTAAPLTGAQSIPIAGGWLALAPGRKLEQLAGGPARAAENVPEFYIPARVKPQSYGSAPGASYYWTDARGQKIAGPFPLTVDGRP